MNFVQCRLGTFKNVGSVVFFGLLQNIVKIPKKGWYILKYKNWKGITLLIVASIGIFAPLRRRFDGVLRKEQVGFRSNRSTTQYCYPENYCRAVKWRTALRMKYSTSEKHLTAPKDQLHGIIRRHYGMPAKFLILKVFGKEQAKFRSNRSYNSAIMLP